MRDNYFNIKRDIEIEKAGGFFCGACLVGKPATEQSPDPRYCQGCYDFLLKEAGILSESGNTRRPSWIPKPQKAQENQCRVSQYRASIMSIEANPKIEVDIIQPSVAIRAIIKRGPKHRQLPEDLVIQLASKDMGSRAIASKLKADHDITVSYKTIQRILSGERVTA